MYHALFLDTFGHGLEIWKEKKTKIRIIKNLEMIFNTSSNYLIFYLKIIFLKALFQGLFF